MITQKEEIDLLISETEDEGTPIPAGEHTVNVDEIGIYNKNTKYIFFTTEDNEYWYGLYEEDGLFPIVGEDIMSGDMISIVLEYNKKNPQIMDIEVEE